MIKSVHVVKENIKENNPNWPQITDHPYRMLIIEGSGFGKTNSLFNLINHQSGTDKIYLYAKDSNEAKYQLLINKRESVGLRHFNDSKTFIEYSNVKDDIYRNIEDYNPNKKPKKLIVFDYMTADILSNKKLNPVVTELFIRGRKLNIYLVFITQFYFVVPKDISLNCMHVFIMKSPNKQELNQTASENSPDNDFQDLINLFKKCTAKTYSFLVIHATLASNNLLHSEKIL